jgi:PAS domain S-box-containing protein
VAIDTADTPRGPEDQIHFQARILTFVKAAIIATGPDGRIVYWNRFAEELYGWRAEEVIGRNILDITVPVDNLQPAVDIMASLHAGKSWEGEFTVRQRDGTHFTASVTDSPIFDEGGVLIGIVGVSHDLTALAKARLELERLVQERTAELKTANKNLHQLSASLIRSQDEVRWRVARELHESAGQDLTALDLDLAAIGGEVKQKNPELAKRILKTCEFAEDICGHLRTMSYLLHPPLLEELGLVSALRHYVEGFSASSNIKVDLEISPDFGRLADGMEIACFRIVQEGLTNIHRHSRSATAAITLRYQGMRVLVEVRDAGRGIPLELLLELESGGGGVGFAGMRERVTQLGGTLEIKSDAKGTVVIAILPLRHAIAALMRRSKGAGFVVVPANIGNQVGR